MKYHFYTAKEIKPEGWLKDQLEIQAAGLGGNLDKIWPDIRDSKWIGGNRDGWERVPYWLDGFIPLAYLLDDEDLKKRAKKYIDAILAAQVEDGWICPVEDRAGYDTWAIQLLSKVLLVYYQCTSDERIPSALYRVLKNYYELLESGTIQLFNWGKYRWFETFIALNFLYERKQEEWIVRLAKLLKDQGIDYTFVMKQWERPLNQWTYDTHIVNLCMMLKSEAISCNLLGQKYCGLADQWDDLLKKYNGTPVGLYTGDECLSGLSPIQGTELCAVVEQMYSLECLFACTGDNKWAEQLELLAFNALPATFSDDMWAHQYVQMSNQMSCKPFPGKPVFRTNGAEAHVFGLEPNYGCCTANFGQGWPKLTLSAFMHNQDEIINVLPVPCSLHENGISIRLKTEYPFRNVLTYTIASDHAFRFKVRIPSFAKRLSVNGTHCKSDDLTFAIAANTNISLTVQFETEPYFDLGALGLSSVKQGSLVFSVPIPYEKTVVEYEKNGVQRKFPYCDYIYAPNGEWRYAYCDRLILPGHIQVSSVPFSSKQPPITLRTHVQKIDWGYEDGYEELCAKLPLSTKPIGEEEEILLYPYGCAKLRMTELPQITKNE